MRMMKMDTFILFTLVTIFQASWSYYVSNSKLPWSRKRDGCNTRVATPTIQYGHKGLTVAMNEQTTKQEVWVGYYQQTTLFEYIGCMSSEDIDTLSIQLGTSNIGWCYSACYHTPFIGIDGQMCYCMQVKPEKDMRKLGCISGCSDTHNAACGGNNFTSVYRILPHNDSRHIPETQEYNKSCLKVHINSEKYITSIYGWRSCSVRTWVFCTSDSDQSVKVRKENKIWRDAATLCFITQGYPTGYKDVQNANYVGIYGWTGIVWSDVIYKDTDLEYSNNSSDISYGYLEYESSVGHVLNFLKEDTRKYILCNDRHEGKETTQLTTIASDDHSLLTKHSNVTTMATERISSTQLPNTPSTSVSLADEIGKSHNDSSTKDTDVTLIVVGSSVSATLLAVVIVILLFLAKRKVLTVRCCKTTDQTPSITNDHGANEHGANEHVQTERRNSNELALPGQISGSLYQSLEAPSGENNDPHTYSDLHMYCALENINVGTNNMESEYTQLSLP